MNDLIHTEIDADSASVRGTRLDNGNMHYDVEVTFPRGRTCDVGSMIVIGCKSKAAAQRLAKQIIDSAKWMRIDRYTVG